MHNEFDCINPLGLLKDLCSALKPEEEAVAFLGLSEFLRPPERTSSIPESEMRQWFSHSLFVLKALEVNHERFLKHIEKL